MAMPRTSLLIAARNEARNLPGLFAALDALQTPNGGLELWIANDHSTDGTGNLLDAWAAQRPLVRILHVTDRLPGLAGKTNALVQIARQCQGYYLLFTDADCLPCPTWAAAMVAELDAHPTVGITTGTTAIRTKGGLFEGYQAMDWLAAVYAIRVFAAMGVPITAMGNNMACTRVAYLAAGGYEAAGHSITEDFTLFQNIRKAGYGFLHRFNNKVLVYTHAQPNAEAWMSQRKRWFSGALQLPFTSQLPFWVQVATYPTALLLALVNPYWALVLVVGKYVSTTLSVVVPMLVLKELRALRYALLFEPITTWSCCYLTYRYFSNRSVEWKGRVYGEELLPENSAGEKMPDAG